MARNSLSVARDGKSGMTRNMVKKILEYLEHEIRENLHFVKISGKKHRTKKQNFRILNWVQEDLEFLRKLKRFYENPETEKLSKKEKIKKMEVELEFMQFGMKSDDNWDRMFTENLRDIRKPCRSPKFYKDYFAKLLK